MKGKEDILRTLREELARWDELLGGLSEAERTRPRELGTLSVKDEVAHLWAWQQISVARMEAGLENREPELAGWPPELDVDSEEHDLNLINAWIYERNRERSWENVYSAWKEQFLRFIELGEAIPEALLRDAGRYPWLRGYSLADVLAGSYEHHHMEHYEPLLAWLKGRRKIP